MATSQTRPGDASGVPPVTSRHSSWSVASASRSPVMPWCAAASPEVSVRPGARPNSCPTASSSKYGPSCIGALRVLIGDMSSLSAEERAVVDTVAEFVDRDVRPVVRELEHANEYPEKLIGQMKAMGIFGLAIPEPYGDAPVSTPCYVEVTAELARGWMTLAGAMGGHTVVAKMLLHFGTSAQKQKYLPRMATGEVRAAMALTEPGGGSDLQAID